VRYATVTDDYGNVVRDTETTVPYQCRLEQVKGSEVTVNRNTRISDWVLYLPPDADVLSSDVIRAQGSDFEVAGPAILHKSPRFESHKEARLIHVG
jgi:hypothetical protein